MTCHKHTPSAFHRRLLWATRTSLASCISFLLLIAPEQTFLPVPVLGIVFAIVIVDKSIGHTYNLFRALMLSSFWGLLFGGIVSNLLRSITTRSTFHILLPFVVMVGTVLIMSMPSTVAPVQPLAVLMFVLCHGLPALQDGESELWYWPCKLCGTLLVGGLVALITSFFPGPFACTSSYWSSRAALLRVRSVSLNYFDKLFDVCETNDELAVSSVFVQSRHMAELVASLEASVGVCEIEKQCADLFCCATKAKDQTQSFASHRLEIEFWKRQQHWLTGMRRMVETRVGEPLGTDQQTFLDLVAPSVKSVIRYVKNKVLPEFASNSSNSSNSSSSCPTTTAVELRERLNAVKKAYKTARMKVIYENYDDVRQQWSKEVFQNRVCRRHTFIHNFWGYVEEMILFLVEKKKRNVERNENAREGTKSIKTRSVSRYFCCSCCCTVPTSLRRPIKMALILGIASLWFVVPTLQGHLNGFWISVTVCFVAQSDVGSSMTKCINRLIGTIVCCAFCMLTLRIVEASIVLAALVMVLFVGVVSLWRDLAIHGYAALTAAFTTPVLLFGAQKYVADSSKLETFIVARVEMTVLGVVLYMLVEILLWPTRPKAIIRTNTMNLFHRIADFTKEAADTVEAIANGHRRKSGITRKNKNKEHEEHEEHDGNSDSVVLVDITIDTSTVPLPAATSRVIKLKQIKSAADALLQGAVSFHHAASSEPDLFQSSQVSYPAFRWKMLMRSQSRLLCSVRRVQSAVCQLRPPLKGVGHHKEYESLMVGRKTCDFLHQFSSQVATVYAKNEQLIFSGEERRRQGMIVEVTSTFRKWKGVLTQIQRKRQLWYDNFFELFESVVKGQAKGLVRVEEEDVVVEMVDGVKEEEKHELETKKEKVKTAVLALEQHNQIMLAALSQAAEDLVREMGQIGDCLEGVWLMK